MHAMAIAQAAKVDRKLYIGNLPTGITPSTVKLIKSQIKEFEQIKINILKKTIPKIFNYSFFKKPKNFTAYSIHKIS